MPDTQIGSIVQDGVAVPKASFRGFEEGTQINLYTDPAAVNAVDLSNSFLIYVLSLDVLFRKDTADTISADNGLTVLLDSAGNVWKSSALPQIEAISFLATGGITAGEEIGPYIAATPLAFAAGLATSEALARTAATAETIFSIQKNLVEVGTITFAIAGTVGTFAAASAFSLVAGDALSIIAPDPGDATLAHFSATLRAIG